MSLISRPQNWRFKLRTILFAVSLAVLVIPLGGIYIFRIYEGELVKQTELELIAQAALIAAVFKNEAEILTKSADGAHNYGIKILTSKSDEYYQPIKPQLKLSAYPIKSRPPEAAATEMKADAIGLEIGARLMPILLEAQRSTLAGIRLLDYQGIVIGGREDLGKSFAHLPEIQQARTGRYASAIRERTIHRSTPALTSISRGTGIRVFVALPVVADGRLYGVVFLSRTPASILEHLYSQKEKVALVGALILLLVIALVIFTSYSIARPLHSLIEQTKHIGGGKGVAEPIAAPITEEVALLSRSFYDMAQNLEHRSEYIRNFAAHVSHEFKTPLAAIQGAIELLEDHSDEMSSDQRARFLRNIAQDTERLKRLVDRLMEMARADVLEPESGTTALTPLIAKLSQRYRDHGLSVTLTGADNLMAKIAPEVLETVLTNLFDNSQQNG
ncbi:MAG TPA: histidine kinase dimerization/phospho-acceptor domain-containing protein, partial [Candidatus Binatus sp.]|nr:histidine kinase dimerization/phospho-acceptor domain-containing protein [Candidatus Binatus sp.]